MVDNRHQAQNPHHNQATQQPKQIKTSPEESEVAVNEKEEKLELADVITIGLRQVMYSRVAMRQVELDVSNWIKEEQDHSPEAKKKIMDQMTNAKLALESLYNRVHMEF